MIKGALVSAVTSSLSIPAPGDLLEFGDTASPAAAYCDVVCIMWLEDRHTSDIMIGAVQYQPA